MRSLISLLAFVTVALCGDAGGGDVSWKTTTGDCTTEYWTKTYTQVIEKDYTTTTYIPTTITHSTTTTSVINSPVTYYSTLTTTDAVNVPYSVTFVSTIYLTSSVLSVGPGATVTSLSVTSYDNTVYITSTSLETCPVVTMTALVTTSVTNSVCEFCKIDIVGTELVYPFDITTSTVYATTYEIFTTISGEGLNASTTLSTSTIYAPTDCPTTCLPTIPTTWIYSGVILTSPTTYVAFTSFEHEWLEPRSDLYGCGELVSATIDLGPLAPQQLPERIIALSTPFSTTFAAPTSLLWYLDSVPTIVAQLSGVPAESCDTPMASGVSATSNTVTLVKAVTSSGTTTVSKLPCNAVDIFQGANCG